MNLETEEYLKIEKLEHKFKDFISMSNSIYIEQIDEMEEKTNLIVIIGNITSILLILYISFNLFGILLIILITLFLLLYKSIMGDIIIPDKLKEIYKKGYYVHGYIQYSSSLYENIEDIIFEPMDINSYKKIISEEFDKGSE